MSQVSTFNMPTTGPLTMAGYSSQLNGTLGALLSANSGASRPAYAVRGTLWAKEASANSTEVYIYTGSADVLLGTVDHTAGKFTNEAFLANVLTALGVTFSDTNLGTFTGSTISNNVSVKTALQSLETAVETNATSIGSKLNSSSPVVTNGFRHTPSTATVSTSTYTPDPTSQANLFLTINSNTTIQNPLTEHMVAGTMFNLVLKQVGTRTVGWGSFYKFPAGTKPVLTKVAGAIDIVCCHIYDSTTILATFAQDLK